MPTVEIKMGQVEGPEGKWVIIVDNKIVECSDDSEEIFNLASKYSKKTPTVTKVLSAHASFY